MRWVEKGMRSIAQGIASVRNLSGGSSDFQDPAVVPSVPFSPTSPSVPRLLRELFGYGVASGVALAVDVSILKTLVDLAHWHYLLASTVAFIAGAGVAYVLSVRYVFRNRRLQNRGAEILWFVSLGAVGLIVNAAVLWIAIGLIGLGLLTAKAIAAVCAFTSNFVLRRVLLFAA
jgi:putative flippase GtrA